jgi:hypothetical protein
MKRMITYAAMASVAGVLALGTATPGQAKQGRNTTAKTTAKMTDYGARGPAYARAGQRTYARGYGAYAYAPAASPYGGCATEGTYGQGLDVSACGGE